MTALPRAPDNSRGVDVFAVLFEEPIERLTSLLYKGAPFPEADVDRLHRLIRRTDALRAALEARLALIEE